MFRTILVVTAIWHLILGGWILFSNGTVGCLACRETILTIMGVISIILGIIGLVSGLRRSDPMPARG